MMGRTLVRRAALLALASLLAAGCDTPKPSARSEPRPAPAPAEGAAADRVARALFAQANQARRQLGLAPLRVDRVLTGVAEAYSRELARRGEVSHESPTPYRRTLHERLRAAGSQLGASAENLASSSEEEALLPLQVVVHWMRTPGSRAPLAAPEFAFAGTGAARADDGTWYVVQIYAAPREVNSILGLPEP